eukprot:CAMPEP_0181085044 /NCGR_PEP_ID=MMETSP1071-20121207/5020_1 /TAXON_ID=35127 /ORGANISM="Thalassiosira sp., Strain NH16" /LENGTH=479 /DNA_ID=CAMNT_0023166821 /DNA_START=54 /DNA_END=1493 /DNA_ORIENTATION=+
MTQPFCHLVMHYSVARLSWKTVKSLRNGKRQYRLSHEKSGRDDVSSLTTSKNDDVSSVEYDILQGWTIIAFHSLYVSTGMEYFARFFVPFYFHLKLIVLIATFVIPSWRRGGADGTGEFGLSPVISYWFDYLIVPCVHRMHDFMDHDPKGWAKQQLAMMPLLIIEYFILPGVLATEEETNLARNKIRKVSTIGGENIKTPPPESFPHPINSANSSSVQCSIEASGERISLREIRDDSKFATEDAEIFTKVSDSQASRKGRTHTKLATPQPDDSESNYKTPPRRQKEPSFFSRTTNNTLTPSSTSKKSFKSILPASVKTRLASSAMRLKKFSHEHHRAVSPHSPSTTPLSYELLDADVGDSVSKAETTIKRIMESPPKKWADENERKSLPRKNRRKRRERLSLGDHLREIVTGDSNIRVRDHLFDLNQSLPSTPRRTLPPHPDRGGVMDEHTKSNSGERNHHVTTRRSTRLAKKNVYTGH